MNLARKIIFGAGVAVGVAALAIDYGNFYCRSCEMPMNHIDLNNFKGVFVNKLVEKWESGDTFSVCNGKECQQYRLLNVSKSTSWVPVKRHPDSGRYRAEGERLGYKGGIIFVDYSMYEMMINMAYEIVGITPDGNVIVEQMLQCDGSERDKLIGACA